jgi:5-methylcytosine-specific restriction endonuclease McrA
MNKSAGRSGARWRHLAAQVRARKDPCYYCRQPIDYTAERNTPESFTVDHRLSWRDHPELREDPGNLVAAHKACNSSKGAGEAHFDIGLQSRTW